MSAALVTYDGTALINDPEIGIVSAPSVREAEFEVRRRKALRLIPGGRGCRRGASQSSPSNFVVSPFAGSKHEPEKEVNHGQFTQVCGA